MPNTTPNTTPDVPLSEKKSYTKPLLIAFALLIALSTSIFFLSRKSVKTPATAATETPSMPTQKAAPSDSLPCRGKLLALAALGEFRAQRLTQLRPLLRSQLSRGGEPGAERRRTAQQERQRRRHAHTQVLGTP